MHERIHSAVARGDWHIMNNRLLKVSSSLSGGTLFIVQYKMSFSVLILLFFTFCDQVTHKHGGPQYFIEQAV